MNRQKSRANGDFYAVERQALANKLLLTPEYLELKRYESIASNAKLYFGSDIPKFFVNGDKQTDSPLLATASSTPESSAGATSE